MTHPPFEFAVPGPIRDRLVASALAGTKTATTSLLVEYETDGDPLPAAGEVFTLVDSEERPVGLVTTSEVTVIRLGDADLQLAIDEGEGFQSVAEWRTAHEGFWNEHVIPHLPDPAANQLTDDTLIVIERFSVSAR